MGLLILLLGASGFVGKSVLSALGESAVTRDRIDLVTAPHSDLVELLDEVSPTAVVNCCGATTGDAVELTRANVIAVARLATAMRTAAPGARLVHVGSAAEYGSVPMGPAITETSACRPVSDYGLTKLVATELLGSADGLETVVLRLFNVIGPGAPPDSLPMRFAARLREEGDLVVGGLEVYRDFVDVRDAAAAIAAAATAEGPLPPVLNVGSGRATAVHDLIGTLVEIASPGTRVLAGAQGSPAVPWQCADVTAVEGALGWRPERSLRTSLADLWASLEEVVPA
ncbi:NAD-dependent epimerase/dehydratase family protein [Nonomuraea sp. NPDC050556]|uniref:NAD-dependent epimerase/dehydratase family protein n=1 Tax=Nonomuraea sp. NPDC050556 TaxID=3364369 RepID=UPI0037B60A5B